MFPILGNPKEGETYMFPYLFFFGGGGGGGGGGRLFALEGSWGKGEDDSRLATPVSWERGDAILVAHAQGREGCSADASPDPSFLSYL